MPSPSETSSPEYRQAIRALSGSQKVQQVFALNAAARKLKAAALRDQHPDWTEEQIQARVKEIFLYARTY
ncbi:MAG TPA: hypothetical protein PKE55_03160 [Kiritimatiellia bacterium]|nr:hypothetical protein [Kiritimatiellia bacterium]